MRCNVNSAGSRNCWYRVLHKLHYFKKVHQIVWQQKKTHISSNIACEPVRPQVQKWHHITILGIVHFRLSLSGRETLTVPPLSSFSESKIYTPTTIPLRPSPVPWLSLPFLWIHRTLLTIYPFCRRNFNWLSGQVSTDPDMPALMHIIYTRLTLLPASRNQKRHSSRPHIHFGFTYNSKVIIIINLQRKLVL